MLPHVFSEPIRVRDWRRIMNFHLTLNEMRMRIRSFVWNKCTHKSHKNVLIQHTQSSTNKPQVLHRIQRYYENVSMLGVVDPILRLVFHFKVVFVPFSVLTAWCNCANVWVCAEQYAVILFFFVTFVYA